MGVGVGVKVVVGVGVGAGVGAKTGDDATLTFSMVDQLRSLLRCMGSLESLSPAGQLGFARTLCRKVQF